MQDRPSPDAFLVGSGEMVRRICSHDWARSLGPGESWPQSLKAIVGFMLLSPLPIVLLWGEDGIMLYNDAYSVFAGGRHPQLLGSKVREGWPEVADFNDNVMKVGLAGGTLAYKDQELTLHRSGKPEQVWMNLDYSPVIDESGLPAGVIAIVVETTDRVLADRRRAAEQQRQRQLLGQMPGFASVVAGPEHTYEYVNDAYEAISGRTDFIGRTFREMFPDLEDQAFLPMLDQVYRSGERMVLRGMELRLHGAESPQYIDFVFEPTRDEDGAVTGVFIGGYEVTEVHRAAEALRASETRLRELNADLERQVIERTQARGRTWQVSPDLMGALNAEGRFITSNPAWMTVLGWTEEEVAGRSIFDLLHPDDIEPTRAGFALTQHGQPAIGFPNRYRCKDGSYRWISWVGVPEDGIVYCTGRDITEEKAAEEALLKAQEALRQSQKMEAMGQLTGGVAHDFNNLLTPIIGSLDMLQARGLGGPREHRLIEGALQSAERAKLLVQRLLAFARRQPLKTEAVDLAALVGGMSALIASTSGPRIEVELDISEGVPPAQADSNQVEMALLNLAVNARDAMPEGGRLTLAIREETLGAGHRLSLPPGRYVRLSVADTGVGMDAATLARAIEPFFSTKGIGKGTGLGLSMVHGLAAQLGGALDIASRRGLGTEVALWLPVSCDPLSADPPLAAAVHGDRGERAGVVLLVDDEALARTSTADMLGDLGYRVVDVGSAEAAIAVFDEGSPVDLLVTDYLMPGMTGAELAVLARGRRPGLPILVISGFAEVDGFDPSLPRLTKPFRRVELAEALSALGARTARV